MKQVFFKIFLILIISTKSLYSQNQLMREEGEYFIKIDEKYIHHLGELNNSSEKFENTLNLTTYKNRFNFLDANTRLHIDYNDITYTYVKKFLNYRWYPKIIGLSVY